MTSHKKIRCAWAQANDLFFEYHDKEWGNPSHDERHLFEMLCLEGAQAGLSWLTILKRRKNYLKAFDSFNAKKIAKFDSKKKLALLKDEGIIRNRLKINSVIENAKAFLHAQKEYGSFDTYIWQFNDADTMSRDLKKRGFRFVGPTICYAFMQAVGMVDDHEVNCFRYKKDKRKYHEKQR